MSEKTRVYFLAMTDSPDPDVVTSVVGRPPDRFRPVGEPIGPHPGAPLRKRSTWTIESGLPLSSPFEDQLEAILSELERLPGITAAIQQFDTGLACDSHWKSANPGFHISESHARRIAALNLSLDLDIYVSEST
jgi:hypothetical protein